MVSVIMVAEKPSICNSIAQALSGGKHETHGKTPPVHTFRGNFRGQQANIKVTSVVGHVFSTDFPSAYQSWDKVDPGTLFDAPVERVTGADIPMPYASNLEIDALPQINNIITGVQKVCYRL